MATAGLQGIDETVQQTYVWVNEVAAGFHGNRHQGFKIIRAFLQTLRDHLQVDESAQLAAQLPMLLRGAYYEGWDPSHNRQNERDAQAFIDRFVHDSGVRPMDARDALASVAKVLRDHISPGEYEDVIMSLPAHVRELLV